MVYCSVIEKNKKSLNDRNIKILKLEKFNYIEINKDVKKYKPDIIQCHDIKATIIGSLFHKQCKIIYHVHSNHSNMRKLNLKTIIYNSCVKNIDKIIYGNKVKFGKYVTFRKGF